MLIKGLRVKSERKNFESLSQILNVIYVNITPEDMELLQDI